jgi:serine/threonine protein kinase
MGEAFLADDLTLKRQVVLRFLPRTFDADPAGLARFEREAQTLASLSHPNIEEIYGLGDAEGRRCLVLEFVEGETLADRIKRGPLPPDDSLRVCRQIADALQAVHERHIVHGDLQPGNVTIGRDGNVRLLDIGWSRVFARRPPAAGPRTRAVSGVGPDGIGGGYKSPEQITGRPVDWRADIWAFGCVLFECLAGAPAFPGASPPAIMAAILGAEPDWRALPASTPRELRTLLRRCLRKAPDRRLHDIADARLELDEALAISEYAAAVEAAPPHASLALPSLFGAAGRAAGTLGRVLGSRRPRRRRPR